MNIYVKLILVALLFDIVLYFLKYQMYYKILWMLKYTRPVAVSKIEQVLYHIQIISRFVPFLIIKASHCKIFKTLTVGFETYSEFHVVSLFVHRLSFDQFDNQ